MKRFLLVAAVAITACDRPPDAPHPEPSASSPTQTSTETTSTPGAVDTPPPKPVDVRLELTETTVEGSFNSAIVERNLSRQNGALERCFTDALATQPNATGTLKVTFELTDNGRVQNAGVTSDDLPPEAFKCTLSQIERARFPAPRGEVTVTAVYTVSTESQ